MMKVGTTLRSVVLGACALALAGCFNNIAGPEGSSSKNSQSNGATLNDSGFANETGPIDTAAVLIGTYNDTATAGFGIMIDLQKSLLATIGGTALQTVIDTIDSNTAMQARPVIVHLPAFGIKAATTLGKIAAGNNKKLRNVMNIRPRLTRIDLTTSALEIPGSPTVLQLKNSNKTVITYGGKIEGDYVRRMTVLIPFAGLNASFLPSISVPTYGDGYPAASPEEYSGSVKLVRVTTEIASLFNKLITNPPYGQALYNSVQSDAIRTITQTKDSLALAVHYKMSATVGVPSTDVEAAYFININPANNTGPETFPFCHIGYDDQDQTAAYGTAGDEVDFSHPLSCNCTAAVTAPNPPVQNYTSTQFIDPCPSLVSAQKPALIAAAVTATPAAPTTGAFTGVTYPLTLNDFTVTAE